MAEPRVRIRLEADSSQAVSEINRTSSSLGDLRGSISDSVAEFGRLAGVVAVIQFLREAVAAASQTEEANLALSESLKKLGSEADALQEKLNAQAAALQSVSRFSDDSITSAQAILATFVTEADTIERLTRATIDLAAAKGIDLASASEAVSRTIGTSAQLLARYGIEAEGAAGSTARAESVIRQLAETSGGAALQSLTTLAGSFAKLRNSAFSALSQIGEFITGNGTLAVVLNQVADGIDRMRGATDANTASQSRAASATRQHAEAVGLTAEQLRKFTATLDLAETATDRLAKKLNIQTSAQLLTQAFEIQQDLILAEEEQIGTEQELARVRAAAIAQIEQLEENARRLAQGLPLIAPAAQEGIGVITEAASEASAQLNATRVSADNARSGFVALGSAAVTATSQIRAMTAAQFDAIEAARGQAAAVQAGIDAGGRFTTGRRFRLPGGGSRLIGSSSFATISGGTFTAVRQSSSVSSDGRIGG